MAIIYYDIFSERTKNMKKAKMIAAVMALLMAGGSMNYAPDNSADSLFTGEILIDSLLNYLRLSPDCHGLSPSFF